MIDTDNIKVGDIVVLHCGAKSYCVKKEKSKCDALAAYEITCVGSGYLYSCKILKDWECGMFGKRTVVSISDTMARDGEMII